MRGMGREIRRVPLDFDWPLHKVWHGFVNDQWRPCPQEAKGLCHDGVTNAAMWMSAIARLIVIAGEEASVSAEEVEFLRQRGRIYPHPYLQEWDMAPRTEIPRDVMRGLVERYEGTERVRRAYHYPQQNPPRLLPLDAELHAVVQGLAGDHKVEQTGGSGAERSVVRSLLKAAGLDPEKWGTCPVCKGEACDPAHQQAYEAWKRTDPPTGEGWQLWETVSEGSPVSPVFPTRDGFIHYLRDEGYSEQAAQRFTEDGWAPSGVIVVGGDTVRAMDGIEAAGEC